MWVHIFAENFLLSEIGQFRRFRIACGVFIISRYHEICKALLLFY